MAFITLTKPYQGHRALVLSHDKAVELQRAMKHPETATPAQKRFIQYVKKVYLGKSQNQKIIESLPEVQTSWVDTDLR